MDSFYSITQTSRFRLILQLSNWNVATSVWLNIQPSLRKCPLANIYDGFCVVVFTRTEIVPRPHSTFGSSETIVLLSLYTVVKMYCHQASGSKFFVSKIFFHSMNLDKLTESGTSLITFTFYSIVKHCNCLYHINEPWESNQCNDHCCNWVQIVKILKIHKLGEVPHKCQQKTSRLMLMPFHN